MKPKVVFLLLGLSVSCLFCGRKSSDDSGDGAGSKFVPSNWDGASDLESTAWEIKKP